MRLILIENSVYRVNEKQYSEILKKSKDMKFTRDCRPGTDKIVDAEFYRFMSERKLSFTLIGSIAFGYNGSLEGAEK